MAPATSSDQYFKAMGRVAHEFAGLEFAIRVNVTQLLKADQNLGMIATAFLDFGKLTDLFDALYKRQFLDDQKKLARFNNLIERIRKAGTDRNRVIHTTWVLFESVPPESA